MDILLVAFWLAPGFLFLWFWNKLVPYRKGSDWTYIAPIAVWSLIFFTFSAFATAFFSTKCCCKNYSGLICRFISFWLRQMPVRHSLELAISAIIATFSGFLVFGISRLTIWYIDTQPQSSFIYKLCSVWIQALKFFGYLNFPDLISKYLYGLLKQEIIIATNMGKFYIGTLISSSQDENENDKAIIICPLWSGYRDVKTHRVIFNTFYQDQERPDLQLMFPLASLVSIGKFDIELHQYFLKTRKTKILKTQPFQPQET